MAYRAILSTQAAKDIARLALPLRNAIRSEFQALCESPTGCSKPSVTPPYPPGYQMFEFNKVSGGLDHYFVVLFKYGQDEESILIHGLGRREVKPFK